MEGTEIHNVAQEYFYDVMDLEALGGVVFSFIFQNE